MVGIRSFPIGFRPIFRGEMLVSGREYSKPIGFVGKEGFCHQGDVVKPSILPEKLLCERKPWETLPPTSRFARSPEVGQRHPYATRHSCRLLFHRWWNTGWSKTWQDRAQRGMMKFSKKWFAKEKGRFQSWSFCLVFFCPFHKKDQ